METPRSLMFVLGLLSLGMCFDVVGIFQGGLWWLYGALLIGRIAAIYGILLRTTTGFWLAVGFFAAILALNGLVLSSGVVSPTAAAVALIMPAICLVVLFANKSEFE